MGLWGYKSLQSLCLNSLKHCTSFCTCQNTWFSVTCSCSFSPFQNKRGRPHGSRGRNQTHFRANHGCFEIPNSCIYSAARCLRDYMCPAGIKSQETPYHVLLSRCLKKRGKQAMREAELGKPLILPEDYKFPPLLLISLQPACYDI